MSDERLDGKLQFVIGDQRRAGKSGKTGKKKGEGAQSSRRREARITRAAKTLAPTKPATNSVASDGKMEKQEMPIRVGQTTATQMSECALSSGKCTGAMDPYCTTA